MKLKNIDYLIMNKNDAITGELIALRQENKQLKDKIKMYEDLQSKITRMYNELKQKVKILRQV